MVSNGYYNSNDWLTLVSRGVFVGFYNRYSIRQAVPIYYSHNDLKLNRFVVIVDDGFFSKK
jgi:hypothetical protein